MPDNQYKIGLESWDLQDGVFDDFLTGQVFDSALTIYTREKYTLKSQGHKSFQHTNRTYYHVEGEIIYYKDLVLVLDCGIRVFLGEKLEEKTLEGKYYEVTGYLGLNTKENPLNDPDMPELEYRWRVDRILLENIPYVDKVEPNGRKIAELDRANTVSRQVNETDAWRDAAPGYKNASGHISDDYSAHYILECTLLEDAPRKVER